MEASVCGSNRARSYHEHGRLSGDCGPVSIKKRKVLIVDDTASMRKFIKYGLEKSFSNIFIDEAVNGREAQAKLDQTEYDLVLCDWEMPDITGNKVLEWVRSHPIINNVPFIMVTSRSDEDSVLSARNGGANDYLVKPFSAEALAKKITAVIDRFGRRELESTEANGAVNLHFSDQVIRGKIIDVSLGGMYSTFSREHPMPAMFEKVMVDLKLENSLKMGGIEGFVIRLQASESFIDAENVKIAVKYIDLPDHRRQELQRLMASIKQQAK